MKDIIEIIALILLCVFVLVACACFIKMTFFDKK